MPDNIDQKSTREEGFLRRYFGFRNFISGTLIKLIYALGAIAVLAGSGAYIAIGITEDDREKIVMGVIGLTAGFLAWRLVCENLILLFSMHERLAEIEKSQRAFSKYVQWYQKQADKK